jgi:16S rRNA (uracil1498-N3)-methyltransferase
MTSRTSASGAGEPKKARWERLAEAARKQCGRNMPMEISTPAALPEWLERNLAGPRILLDPSGGPLPRAASGPGTLLVGPEGGFSTAETALILSRGFSPASLGNVRLRSETAALAALALWSPRIP